MRMKLLRIKDNSQQKKDAFSQVARLTGKIADKTLEQLEREGVFVFPETVKDAEDITQDQIILQSVNDTCRSSNVMGFLGYDNSLMELIRHTVEFIKRKPYGNKLLIKVKDEVKLVIDATPGYEPYDRQKIIEQNKKNTVRHAYFREYLALQRLCLLILRHQRHQIGTGASQIYGILFDGAWLWEEYINLLLEDIFYHPMNKSGTGAQRLFDGNVGLIYPDFISRNSEPRIIADAKYKPLDNIGNRDYLQVLAYMFRFDAKIGYYLYPEAKGAEDLKLWMNRGSTYEKNVVPRDDVSVTKHGLQIPVDAGSYSEFAARMRDQEERFVRVFA
mgnify:CR=1 FL=1